MRTGLNGRDDCSSSVCLSTPNNEEMLSQSFFPMASLSLSLLLLLPLPLLLRFCGSNNTRTTIIQSWCRVNTLNYLRISLRCSLCTSICRLIFCSLCSFVRYRTGRCVYTNVECRASLFNRKSNRSTNKKKWNSTQLKHCYISSSEGCKRWNYYNLVFTTSYLLFTQFIDGNVFL